MATGRVKYFSNNESSQGDVLRTLSYAILIFVLIFLFAFMFAVLGKGEYQPSGSAEPPGISYALF